MLLMLKITLSYSLQVIGLRVYTGDVCRPAKAQRPYHPSLTFPTVQAQEANTGWWQGGLTCKTVSESSLGELPERTLAGWRGPMGADDGEPEPRKHEAVCEGGAWKLT